MALLPHLYLKHGRYYARFRVPRHLSLYLDQGEIRWSLCTANLKTARKHLLIASVLIQELFTRVLMQPSHVPLTEREKIAIKNRIEQIKLEKMAEFRALIGEGPSGVAQAQALLTAEQPDMDAFQSALDANHFDAIEVKGPFSQILSAAERLAYDFSALNPNYDPVAKEFCTAMLVHHQNKLAILQGVPAAIAKPNMQAVTTPYLHADQQAPAEYSDRVAKVSDAVEAYLTEQKAQGILEKTVQEYRSVLRRIVEFSGDCALKRLGREDIRLFRETLKKYPARPTTAQRKLGFRELAAVNTAAVLNVASIKKHLTRISQMLIWAARNGYGNDPTIADGLMPKDRRKESEARDRFEQADITAIFSTPLYQGEATFSRAAYYWAPLLALYAGLRVEEICQLRVVDIRKDSASGLSIIDINDDDDDRKLKPGQSTARVLPVHSKLIELGLLDYVALVRSKKHRMLFPTLNRHGMNGYSHAVTKWFSDYKKSLGFGAKQTFHSFRHTVDDTLKQSGTQEAMINGVMGHTGKNSISIQRYGKAYRPEALAPIIEIVKFDMPAKPFGKITLSDQEKKALQSVANAMALREKRLSDRAGKALGQDQE
jgi:integrase